VWRKETTGDPLVGQQRRPAMTGIEVAPGRRASAASFGQQVRGPAQKASHGLLSGYAGSQRSRRVGPHLQARMASAGKCGLGPVPRVCTARLSGLATAGHCSPRRSLRDRKNRGPRAYAASRGARRRELTLSCSTRAGRLAGRPCAPSRNAGSALPPRSVVGDPAPGREVGLSQDPPRPCAPASALRPSWAWVNAPAWTRSA
jgi:hypothetical protein